MLEIYPNQPVRMRIRTGKLVRFSFAVRLISSAVLLSAVIGCHSAKPTAGTGQHLDFNQDVQPILASNCFSCHGPDPEMRKGGLRLDLEESAFRKRAGHPDAPMFAALRNYLQLSRYR